MKYSYFYSHFTSSYFCYIVTPLVLNGTNFLGLGRGENDLDLTSQMRRKEVVKAFWGGNVSLNWMC